MNSALKAIKPLSEISFNQNEGWKTQNYAHTKTPNRRDFQLRTDLKTLANSLSSKESRFRFVCILNSTGLRAFAEAGRDEKFLWVDLVVYDSEVPQLLLDTPVQRDDNAEKKNISSIKVVGNRVIVICGNADEALDYFLRKVTEIRVNQHANDNYQVFHPTHSGYNNFEDNLNLVLVKKRTGYFFEINEGNADYSLPGRFLRFFLEKISPDSVYLVSPRDESGLISGIFIVCEDREEFERSLDLRVVEPPNRDSTPIPGEKGELENETLPKFGFTKAGTPRLRRSMRSASELGGDPNSEENRYEVKLGGRIDRDLRDHFLEVVKARGVPQGRALELAIQYFIEHPEAFDL
jgi:hypothetical protein